MSVTMYNRSKVRFENVLHNLETAKSNALIEDAYFDTACFDVQQAIEFLMKAILLEYNIPFNKKEGHDILYLLQLIQEHTDFTFDRQSELELLASTITSWEEKGRYSTGVKTKENTVRRALNIYKSMDRQFIMILQQKNKNIEEPINSKSSFENNEIEHLKR